ncbi:RNA-directed DNA polymerase [Enterococcus plantarum]|uniref:RNA-directed DNA polymerase n=1 Tax=Enterococcus TaxID=1350 RepID=UPI001A8C1DFF|nr:RNA-directed DNA polymerase [Enterococcus plantarum]MBO0423118.1 RNA-directed DNA polymerase [Enterococcus plantarum]
MYSKQEIRKACNRAIKNIIHEGTTDVDIFNRPFEIEFLRNEITKNLIVDKITKSILSGELKESEVKSYGRVLVPKKTISDFRICALIDIYDEIFYLTLVILLCRDIEKNRIIPSKKNVFSYRVVKDMASKELFDGKYNYTSFKKRVKEQEEKVGTNIVIECDISNFYDRLNLHRLESMLLSIKGIDKESIRLLNDLLLYWSNRDSYGLPVGSNASRILAEAALIGVDDFLVSKKIRFCRFVDDYRIFAIDSTEAYHNLTLLIERLQIEGLFINSNKTKIRLAKVKSIERENQKNEERQDEDTKIITETIEMTNETYLHKKLSNVISGYSGLIPLKFRRLTITEIEKLRNVPLNEKYNFLMEKKLIDPIDLREYFKVIVAQEQWKYLSNASLLLAKIPQFIPYFTDIVIKYDDCISDDIIAKIYESFEDLLKKADTPEYIQIHLIKLFSEGKRTDKQILLQYFFDLNRDSGDYIGRAVLEALNGKLTRGELLTLRGYFKRADIWEKRQLMSLLNEGLPPEERNAYFKNISITNSDIFVQHMTNKKTKFMKN